MCCVDREVYDVAFVLSVLSADFRRWRRTSEHIRRCVICSSTSGRSAAFNWHRWPHLSHAYHVIGPSL